MKARYDPGDCVMEAILKRSEVTGIFQPMTDRRLKVILVQGFRNEYDAVKIQIYRAPSFGFDDAQKTMRHPYLDAKSRSSEDSEKSPGAAM